MGSEQETFLFAYTYTGFRSSSMWERPPKGLYTFCDADRCDDTQAIVCRTKFLSTTMFAKCVCFYTVSTGAYGAFSRGKPTKQKTGEEKTSRKNVMMAYKQLAITTK